MKKVLPVKTRACHVAAAAVHMAAPEVGVHCLE